MTLCRTMAVTWGIVLLASSAGWAQSLMAAVLPSSRSVEVGTSATFVATMINAGQEVATDCEIWPLSAIPATVSYTSLENGWGPGAVDIPPGAAHRFVVEFVPRAPIAPIEVQLSFKCVNTEPAPIFPGVNTVLLSASATPVADIVAMAMTPSNDGIVKIAGRDVTGVFAVATVNLGADDTLTVSADTGDAVLPVSISICQTEPTTSDCLSSPGSTVTATVPSDSRPTFGVFLTVPADAVIPFVPQSNRVFVRFTDSGGVTRGSTSVALWTSSEGYWDIP